MINSKPFYFSDISSIQNFISDKKNADTPIKNIMGKPYPIVKKNVKIDAISKLISKENEAVLVDLENGNYHIITKYDIISAI